MSDRWEGILDPGEKILWQGRPDPTWVFEAEMVPTAAFGTFFAGFSLFWMAGAAQAEGFFWTFGLLFFFVGLSVVLSAVFGPTFNRRQSFYTLTDRRALIATDMPLLGRKLKRYPITAGMPMTLTDSDRATIHFAEKVSRTRNGTTLRPIGFERISDGRDVYRLMREVQENLLTPETDQRP